MKIKISNITSLDACKKISRLASPIILSRLINTTTTFVSMLLIAKLGHTYLAAGALITTISTMLLVTVWSLLFSVGVVCGRAYGANKKEELGNILRASLLLGTIAGLPVTLVMLNIAPTLRFFHQQEELIILTQQYFNGLSWSVIPSIWYLCILQLVVAVGRQKMVLIWSLISIPCTLIPCYGLLFGKFGLSAIGISGSAYANSFSSGFLLLLAIFYLLNKNFKDYRLFSSSKISTNLVKQLFLIGYPISIQFGAELVAFSISAIFFGWLSKDALAAFQAAIQINMIVIMVPYGLAQASAILIGQAIGHKDISIIKSLNNAALLLGIIFMLIVATAYLLIPKTLMSIYLTDIHSSTGSNTIKIGVIVFAIMAISQFFDGIRNIVTGSLRGFYDTKAAMVVGVLVSCVFAIPLNYILGFYFSLGAAGLGLGFAVGVIIGAWILLHRFYKKCEDGGLSIQPIRETPYYQTNQ
jgi:multidrug resistance protein, MATE family